MRKAFIKNLIIVLCLMLLLYLCRFVWAYSAENFGIYGYISMCIIAILFGVSLAMMDFAYRINNVIFACFFLTISLISQFTNIWNYSPVIYLTLCMFGYLLFVSLKRGDRKN